MKTAAWKAREGLTVIEHGETQLANGHRDRRDQPVVAASRFLNLIITEATMTRREKHREQKREFYILSVW